MNYVTFIINSCFFLCHTFIFYLYLSWKSDSSTAVMFSHSRTIGDEAENKSYFIACGKLNADCVPWLGERERERIRLSAFFGTEDIGVHIVHISRVIITYTLGYLSSLTKITHNLQVIINLRKKTIKMINEKSEGPINLTNHWRKRLWISLHVDLKRLN